MNTLSTEVEFKFAVRDESAFEALTAQLGLPAQLLDNTILQINHFFDTPQLALRSSRLAIRLREQSGAFYLTIKGGKSEHSHDRVLSSRIEEERLLDRHTAQTMLDGSIPVFDVITEQFSDRAHELVDLIGQISAGQPLTYIGKFENRRIKLPPVRVPRSDIQDLVVFELDAMSFPGQARQYEIEVEVPTTEGAGLIHGALVALLSAAGIDWSAAPSKAERFFQSVKITS